jgi:hypothetical protein
VSNDYYVTDVGAENRQNRQAVPYDDRLLWTDVWDLSTEGVPYLIPEIVLLFKAKHTRPKDRADLDAVLAMLVEPRRAWLHAAVEQVHPEHPWLGVI